jgi:hypothetical protein
MTDKPNEWKVRNITDASYGKQTEYYLEKIWSEHKHSVFVPHSLLDQIRREAINEFVKELNTAYSIKWLPIQVKRVLHSKGLLEKYTGDIPEEKKE